MRLSPLFPVPLRRIAPVAGLLLFAALAAPGLSLSAEQEAPITIEANRMVSQENDNAVVFMGKVVAKQGAMTIRTDEMTVFYSDTANGDKAAGQLERLVCKNNVKITQDDWLGTGSRLDYFAKGKKAVLSGDAKAWNGPNMVTGKTITYYLDEKRSVVEPEAKADGSAGGRVRATLRPGAGN